MILKHIADVNEQDKKEKMVKIESQRALMQEVKSWFVQCIINFLSLILPLSLSLSLKQVAKANAESMERKKQQKTAEEEEDLKVLQYLLDKEKREIENDKLQQARKIEREKELARLRALQEKMSDKQAAQDALRAQRAYEAYEREWRRKEKEMAEKHAAQERELREDRLKQQNAREHAIAVEAHKMRIEFMENIRRQKQIEEKIQEEERVHAEKNKIYSSEVKVI